MVRSAECVLAPTSPTSNHHLNFRCVVRLIIERSNGASWAAICLPLETINRHSVLTQFARVRPQVLDAAVPGKELHAHVVAARVRMDMKVAWGDVKDQVWKHKAFSVNATFFVFVWFWFSFPCCFC